MTDKNNKSVFKQPAVPPALTKTTDPDVASLPASTINTVSLLNHEIKDVDDMSVDNSGDASNADRAGTHADDSYDELAEFDD